MSHPFLTLIVKKELYYCNFAANTTVEKNINSLKNNIESLLVLSGGIKEYHAQIITGAIMDLLKEEGLIKDEEDEKESYDPN